jgi:pimeloyl-ACP methyl ester carboxylesterase
VAQLTLADGRTLAYTDGDADGTPVVLFHGAPGARGFRPRAAESRAAGVRLITFDRPGYDGSDAVEAPTVLGVARDVLELADALALDRFGVAAWSGGVPAAVATAFAAPERVTRLALAGGPGPLDEVPGGWEALGEYMRPTAEMARREPHRATRSVARHMEPYLENPVSFLGSRRGPDAAVFADPELGPMLDAQVVAAIAPGPEGITADLVAMWLPWGFALGDVSVPTTVFHAALDPHNELDARTYADRIPDARLVVWPGAGHLGILAHWPEVLASVVGPSD